MRMNAHIAVIALYLATALLFTFPLALNFNAAVPGSDGDAFWFMWNMHWFKTATLELGSNPFYTDYLLYPYGQYYYLATFSPFNCLVSIPLQALFGLTAAYNLLLLFYVVLAAYGAFLLARHLTGSGIASFFAGLAFGFSPYLMAKAIEHLNLLGIAWIPLFILFFIKSLEENGWGNAAVAGLILAIIGFTDWQVLMQALLLMAIYSAARLWLWRGRLGINGALRAASGIALGIAILSPLILAAAAQMSSPDHIQASQAARALFSLDLLDFVNPPLFSTLVRLFGGISVYYHRVLFLEFGAGYIGAVVATASAIAFFNVKKPQVRVWAAVAAAFAILSLGPSLQIAGIETGIPLPAALLQLLPGISMVRVSTRFFGIAVLALSVLSAYGLAYFSRGALKKAGLFASAAALILLVEFLPVPFILMRTDSVPQFYGELASEPGDFAILEVPCAGLTRSDGLSIYIMSYSYYQTIHMKKRVDGIGNMLSPRAYRFIYNTPFISRACDPHLQTDIVEQEGGFERDLLAHYGIRYVLFHREYPSAKDALVHESIIRSALGEPVYDDGKTAVFSAGTPVGRPFISLVDGWGTPVSVNGAVARAVESKASMVLVSNSAHSLTLRIAGRTDPNSSVTVLVGGENAATVKSSPSGEFDFEFTLDNPAGETNIELIPASPAWVSMVRLAG